MSSDVHATYEALRDAGAEITQEPVTQPYGTDFGIRDPSGNQIRINQFNDASTDEAKAGHDTAKA